MLPKEQQPKPEDLWRLPLVAFAMGILKIKMSEEQATLLEEWLMRHNGRVLDRGYAHAMRDNRQGKRN